MLDFFEDNQKFLFHPQFIVKRAIDTKVKLSVSYFAIGSKILDVGCGSGPYWHLRPDCELVGLDVYQSKPGIIVIKQGSPWEISDSSFDGVLCTQVLEHTFHFQLMLSEIERILKPGGILIISAPFVFPYHGVPDDFHRFTEFALNAYLQDFKILGKSQVCNYFETMAVSKNLQLSHKLQLGKKMRILSILGFPLVVLIYSINNLKALLLAKLDKDSIFPSNVVFVCKKVIKIQ